MLLICAGRAALTDIWSARVDAHVQQPRLAGGVSARLLTALMSSAMNAHLINSADVRPPTPLLWKGRCLVSHLGHSHYANPRNRQHITYNSPFVPKGLCSCGKPQGNASCTLQAPPLWVGNCTPVIYHRGLPGLEKRMHQCDCVSTASIVLCILSACPKHNQHSHALSY